MKILILFCVFGSFLFGAGYYAGSGKPTKTDDEVINTAGLSPDQIALVRIFVQQVSGTIKTEQPKKHYFDFSYPEKKTGAE